MSGLTLAGLAALALAGCGSGTIALSTPTPTATAWTLPTTAPSPTPWPTSSVKLVSDTPFTCPAAVSGNQKLFADAETGLKFSYPASLTEQGCERIVTSDGSETLHIGNLFSVWAVPRNSLTVEQFVNQQTDQYEIVTLAPLTVAHAESAVSVKAEPAATPGPRPFDAEPFAGAQAIVAGTRSFYIVFGLTAERNVTDSTSPLGPIIVTFDVP
jgi:hypothetical protein